MTKITVKRIRYILAVMLAAVMLAATACAPRCSSSGPAEEPVPVENGAVEDSRSAEAGDIPENAVKAASLDELKAAIDDAAGSPVQTVIYLASDIEQQAVSPDEIIRIPADTDIRIISGTGSEGECASVRQMTVQSAAKSAVIAVEGSLTLENVRIDANSCGRAVYVERGGSMILESGAVITGGTTTSKNVNSGLGVYVAGAEAQGESFGTLIIEDGSRITGNSHTVSAYGRALGIGVFAGGSVIMNGGEISGNTDTTDPTSSEPRAAGGGVYAKSNASSAASPWVSSGNANFTMNGGLISGNIAFAGGGIFAGDYSTIELNGGAISGNTAVYAGGALAVDGNSGNTENLARLTVHIGDGMTLNDNTAEAGGAVYAGSGTVTIGSAEISGNCAVTDEDSPKPSTTVCPFASSGGSGGAIFMAQAEVVIDGASITGNRAVSNVENSQFPVGNGGAVYVTNASNYIYPCTLTVKDCLISGNEASGSGLYAGMGGGICAGFEPNEDTAFVPEADITGGIIRDNKAQKGNDVFICTELTYKTRGYGGYEYGVGTQNAFPVINVSQNADIGDLEPSDYHSGNEGKAAGADDNNDPEESDIRTEAQKDAGFLRKSIYAGTTLPEDAVRVSDQAGLTGALQEHAGFIVLDDDITLVKPLTVSQDLVVYGQGHTLSLDTSLNEEGVIRVISGSLLADALHIDGGSRSRTVYVDEGASAVLNACILCGRTLTSKGLSVFNAGNMTVRNTLIRNAASASVTYQGIIYNSGVLEFAEGSEADADSYVYTGTVFNDGRFVMSGGTLSGTGSNSNRRKYGAAVTNNGEFLMSGGTISGCRNSEAVFSSGSFIMTGGSIRDNISTCLSGMTYNSVFSGGGVLVYGGTFEMYDGAAITGNTGYMGAGVGVYYTGSLFRMYGGLISGNSAGIDPDESAFNENNGCGGGVGVYGGAEFEMLGGSISGNTAYIGDMAQTSRMSGGNQTFFNTGLGGGIYITGGSVSITGGTVSGNIARCAPYGDEGGLGGGIYIRDPGNGAAKVSITGGNVSGNNAEGFAGEDIFSGSMYTLTEDLICLKVGADAQIGDVWLSGNRLMLGVCSTLTGLQMESLCSAGRTSTGSAIVRYDDAAESNPSDAGRFHFAGAADLTMSSSGRELVIGLIDLSRVTSVEIADVTFTGKVIEASALNAKLIIDERFEISADGLSGLRAYNMRNNTECGTALTDLRGDSIRYSGILTDIPFRIVQMPLDSSGISVEFAEPDAVYISDGRTEIKPEIRLVLDSRSSDDSNEYLTEGEDGDYTVSYRDNISSGTGTISLTATDNPGSNYTGSRTVTFEIFDRADAEKLEIDHEEVYLPAGGGEDSTLRLSCSIYPEGAYGTDIIWTSSDSDVAEVDEHGLITARSCGDALITARAADEGGAEASCSVHVLFRDVAGSNIVTSEDYQYYFDPVYWAVNSGIAEGNNGNVYFGTGERCSKGDFLIMLWKYSGRPEDEKYSHPEDIFEDMKGLGADDDLYKAAAWGYAEKIVIGSKSGKSYYLNPQVTLSRADLAIMLWRLAGRPRQYGRMKYSDVSEAGYSRKTDLYQAVLWITGEGIAKGYRQDGSGSVFGLNKVCYKEYTVTYLHRFDQLQIGK